MTDVDDNWTFLSNHAHVMIVLARDPTVRVREMAVLVGITERAVQRIIADLVDRGVIRRHRVGRRNHYQLNWEFPLRHPLERHHTIGELLIGLVPALAAE